MLNISSTAPLSPPSSTTSSLISSSTSSISISASSTIKPRIPTSVGFISRHGFASDMKGKIISSPEKLVIDSLDSIYWRKSSVEEQQNFINKNNIVRIQKFPDRYEVGISPSFLLTHNYSVTTKILVNGLSASTKISISVLEPGEYEKWLRIFKLPDVTPTA
jgi:hypothetical protein